MGLYELKQIGAGRIKLDCSSYGCSSPWQERHDSMHRSDEVIVRKFTGHIAAELRKQYNCEVGQICNTSET